MDNSTVVLLEKYHIRSDFQCEETGLTDYLHKQVNQDIKKGLATCFVVADENHKVLGYYTLSTESLGQASVPTKYVKHLPKNYNVPVVFLGRLARDKSQRGKGLGEFLLMDALFRSYYLSKNSIGAMAVVVDPISDFAFNFYKKYGFIELPDSGRMFLPMKLISKLL
ncbi:MAG: hypothetical protein Kow0079_14150 [Vicingaceae bacterium]